MTEEQYRALLELRAVAARVAISENGFQHISHYLEQQFKTGSPGAQLKEQLSQEQPTRSKSNNVQR